MEQMQKNESIEKEDSRKKILEIIFKVLFCIFCVSILVFIFIITHGYEIKHSTESKNETYTSVNNNFISKAIDDYNAQQYNTAIEKLNTFIEEKSTQSDADISQAYTIRGKSKAAIGDTKGAMIDWEESLLVFIEDNKIAYVDIGIVYQNIGDYKKSIESYEKAIAFDLEDKKNPSNESILFSEAKIYQTTSDRKKLESVYSRLLAVNSQNAKIYADRAFYLYGNTNEHEKALLDYTKSLTLNPHDQFSRLMKAHTEFKLDRKEEMCVDIKQIDMEYLKGFELLYETLKADCK